jgi:glyoxylase I family protein
LVSADGRRNTFVEPHWCHVWQLDDSARKVSVVKKVAHTGFTVRDLDASIVFWTDVLGFEVVRRLELSGHFAEQVTGVDDAHLELAVLVGGGHHIELLQYFGPTERGHVRPSPCDVGSFHIAVSVDDLDATAAVCAQHGWKLAGEPQLALEGPLAGSCFAYLQNQDGFIVELIQEPPSP